MISFLRELAALPLKSVFYILKTLHLSLSIQFILVRWIWKIGHEIDWAHAYLLYSWHLDGEDKTREIADHLLCQEKNAYIAYYMGDLEYHFKKDIESAKKWIQKAEQMDCSHPEMLMCLKLVMSGAVPEYNDVMLVQKILDRNDLSMEHSRFALLKRAQLYIRQKNWGAADDILDKMLKIESHYKTHIFKWITSLAKGDQVSAQKQLKTAEKTCGQEQLYIEQAIGLYWLGEFEKAREFLLRGFRDEDHRKAVLFFQPFLAELLEIEKN